MENPIDKEELNMAKIAGKGRKTWDDGTCMTYKITDDGILYISGVLKGGNIIDIRSAAPFHHVVIEDGVTSIGGCKHYGMFYGMEEMEELTLPSTLKVIGSNAFKKCTRLRCIHFSEGLVSIGQEAFQECESLEKICLPQTVTKIGAEAFSDCKNLAKATLPNNISVISTRMFDCCSSLKSIKVPKGVTSIEESAFRCCYGLKEVSLPKGLQSISTNSFMKCESLEKINFPKSISHIGSNAFKDCGKLQGVILENEKITLGYGAFGEDECSTIVGEDGMEYDCWISNVKTNVNNVGITRAYQKTVKGDIVIPGAIEYKGKTYTVTEIAEEAFAGSKELTSVTLPDSIIKIGEYAFLDCPKLKSAKLGKSVRRIGEQAFAECKELEEVYLGETVEYIDMDVFSHCRKLKSLVLPDSLMGLGCYALESTEVFDSKSGTVYLGHVLCGYNGYLPKHSYLEVREGTTVIAERAFSGDSHLEGVTFPNSVKVIGYCAFDECESLKYIKLPKSLIKIGDGAFAYTAISEVVAPWKKPIKIDHEAFPEKTVIYIPKGSMEAYANAEFWNKYKLVER